MPPVLPLLMSLSKDEGLYPDMSFALNLSLRFAVCEVSEKKRWLVVRSSARK